VPLFVQRGSRDPPLLEQKLENGRWRVGVHGTDQPALIPGHPSHGCIRLKAEDLQRLSALLQIGTPVRIS